jgi:hypothetical protein
MIIKECLPCVSAILLNGKDHCRLLERAYEETRPVELMDNFNKLPTIPQVPLPQCLTYKIIKENTKSKPP